ncbi:hypothetical protein NK8_73920 (plasmid) [Caballeronia sp. NK8]|uniref:ATP-dependent DNA ligase n=1 Tax=Caballeronia sp. NK8 TaxID=140098 RepID=UPI001BB5827A|nr:hypothetical protein [Caballeronia sp. NK8]BCQ29202.1 hypothetical protein NK8_73920 [Caballeronia sp. NK8]
MRGGTHISAADGRHRINLNGSGRFTIYGVPVPGQYERQHRKRCLSKFDGYRLMCRLDAGRVKLITRGGHDWTEKMRTLATAIEDMPVDKAWLDGEVVVLTETGIPDFNALQNAFDRRSTAQLTFFAFDIPFLIGRDLREVPLSQRRELLGELIAQTSSERVRFSESFTEDPESLLASACRMRLEGIIGKRADAPYCSGRSTDWIKLL